MEIFLQDFLNLERIPTDFDNKFISNFINIHLTICEKSLNKLALYYRNHLNATGKPSEVLLAFYIEILRKICQNYGSSILLQQNVIEFLLENELLIFDEEKSSATLQQMAYNLLLEAETSGISIGFKVDLNSRIIAKLSSESTNLYVRKSVEALAINHLTNLITRCAIEKSSPSYLLFNLTEHLLDADYQMVIDSLARVILKFSDKLNDSQSNRLIEKARNMKKLGFPFIQLVAALFCFSKLDNLNLLKSFNDFNSQTSIIIELWKFNRETSKFEEWFLLDILMENTEKSVDFLISIIYDIKFDSVNPSNLFLERLIDSIGNPRYCSIENIEKFIKFSFKIGAYSNLLPTIIKVLIKRILENPEILHFFPNFPEIFNNHLLLDSLENFVKTSLIETSLTQCENGWEKRDSALEILEISYEYLNIDTERLLQNLIFFGTSIAENQFVRSKSRKVLLNILKQDGGKCRNYKLNIELLELCKKQCEIDENEEAESLDKVQQIGVINAQKAELEDIIQAMQNTCCLNDCVSKECY